jgi:SAM-dependent methyltransferase
MILSLSERELLEFCSQISPEYPYYDRFINEARFGLSRILPHLARLKTAHPTVLDVGAGSCILPAYLASRGITVAAVEPLGPGFGFYTDLQNHVLELCRKAGSNLHVIRVMAEKINLQESYDFSYTINALEHMPDPCLALDSMYHALRPGGILLAHCPNYNVPFDSHFGIFLLTRSKGLNRWLYRSTIGKDPVLWDELNLIGYTDLRRHFAMRGYDFVFNRSILREMFERVIDDRLFAERMPALFGTVGRLLKRFHLFETLQHYPLLLQSPMEVVIEKP